MTEDLLNIIREWIRAEIEYAIEANDVDSDGYANSAYHERKRAEELFQTVVRKWSKV